MTTPAGIIGIPGRIGLESVATISWNAWPHSSESACVYLHAFETGSELRAGLSRWIGYYNTSRPHSALAGRTPDKAYGAAETENWQPDENQNQA